MPEHTTPHLVEANRKHLLSGVCGLSVGMPSVGRLSKPNKRLVIDQGQKVGEKQICYAGDVVFLGALTGRTQVEAGGQLICHGSVGGSFDLKAKHIQLHGSVQGHHSTGGLQASMVCQTLQAQRLSLTKIQTRQAMLLRHAALDCNADIHGSLHARQASIQGGHWVLHEHTHVFSLGPSHLGPCSIRLAHQHMAQANDGLEKLVETLQSMLALETDPSRKHRIERMLQDATQGMARARQHTHPVPILVVHFGVEAGTRVEACGQRWTAPKNTGPVVIQHTQGGLVCQRLSDAKPIKTDLKGLTPQTPPIMQAA